MNAKQKLHNLKLEQWSQRFREQAQSGLTVKDWCAQNNITIHTYNYWKHKLKLECLDTAFENHSQEIVPLSFSPASSPQTFSALSCNSLNSRFSHDRIYVSVGDIALQVDSSVSDERLLRIMKAVRHA